MFKYDKVKKEDCRDISELIQEEFPYTNLSYEKIKEKIYDEKFFLIKAHQKNIIIGFAELQYFEDKARMNAVFVEESFRGQGGATKLIHTLIHECKRKRIHTIFLLVKEKNFGAKKLYIKNGFKYKDFHDKEIDGSKVEIWEKKIS